MGPAIALRLRQHLTLTPQVQQALRLLQMSALEFAQEMEQAIAANPFLEENTEAAGPAGTKADGAESQAEGSESPGTSLEEIVLPQEQSSGVAPRTATRKTTGAVSRTPSPACRSICASSCACRASAIATARWPRW
jgi:DNA-directed RNA polymerase specialized sigma54-like protein